MELVRWGRPGWGWVEQNLGDSPLEGGVGREEEMVGVYQSDSWLL